MRSLLFRDPPVVTFSELASCRAGRQEVSVVIKKGGKLFKATARDKVVVEDPFLVMVKAVAFSIKESTPYSAQDTPRSIRDFLIRSNVGVV